MLANDTELARSQQILREKVNEPHTLCVYHFRKCYVRNALDN